MDVQLVDIVLVEVLDGINFRLFIDGLLNLGLCLEIGDGVVGGLGLFLEDDF